METCKNIVDKNIFCFWTGGHMSNIRSASIQQLKTVSKCNVIFLTLDKINEYILKDHPLHPSFNYLSAVHKADYLRTYFMRFHGGGYSDVKRTTGSWIESFEKLSTSDKWIIGYKEAGPHCIAGDAMIRSKWRALIGNGCYICKPNTPFVIEWYDSMIKLLDEKYEKLKKYPASIPRDKKELYENKDECYPIGWNEMLGNLFHRIQYKHVDKVLNTLPPGIFKNYK